MSCSYSILFDEAEEGSLSLAYACVPSMEKGCPATMLFLRRTYFHSCKITASLQLAFGAFHLLCDHKRAAVRAADLVSTY